MEVGDPIILDCIAEGEPPPEVMWLMDWLPIATVVNDTVVIANATEEDEGRYTCIAENVAGSAVSEVFISVEAGEEETECKDCTHSNIIVTDNSIKMLSEA